ncbi:hypothetical protein L7F22_064180 [Adiantum nelumboides]|nr:hypothetical protein [Adiantum nelumboides]
MHPQALSSQHRLLKQSLHAKPGVVKGSNRREGRDAKVRAEGNGLRMTGELCAQGDYAGKVSCVRIGGVGNKAMMQRGEVTLHRQSLSLSLSLFLLQGQQGLLQALWISLFLCLRRRLSLCRHPRLLEALLSLRADTTVEAEGDLPGMAVGCEGDPAVCALGKQRMKKSEQAWGHHGGEHNYRRRPA